MDISTLSIRIIYLKKYARIKYIIPRYNIKDYFQQSESLFFLRKNINHIITLICNLIRIYSNGIILFVKFQNVTELLIVMRSMYLPSSVIIAMI